MEGFVRYSVSVLFSITLIMFSFGSIPQTFAGPPVPAGTIDSLLTVLASCGLSVTGSADFGEVSIGGTIFNSEVTISNDGSGLATIIANVGTSLVSSLLAGGYAGVTDLTTHIPPRNITLQIDSQGRVSMFDSGSDVLVGELANSDPGILEIGVLVNPVNLPTADPVWVATYDLTVSDCQVI